MSYYRMIEADYALVGLKSEIAPVGRRVSDSLRREGLRVGCITLGAAAAIVPEVVEFLAQVRAVGVVEPRGAECGIGPRLIGILRQAAQGPDWPFPGRAPRVYSALLSPDCSAIREEHLVALVRAMHAYGPNQFVLHRHGAVVETEDRHATPTGKTAHPPRLIAVA